MDFSAFCDYLVHYWRSFAEPVATVGPNKRRRPPDAVRDMLDALVKLKPSEQDPSDRRSKCGYDSSRRLLWVRRTRIAWLAKEARRGSYATNFADPDQPFVRDTTRFATSAGFDALRRSGYQELLDTLPRLDVTDCGAVVVGREGEARSDDVLWIGITPLAEIAHRPFYERPALLRLPILPLAEPAPMPSWVNSHLIQQIIDHSRAEFLTPAVATYRANTPPPHGRGDEAEWIHTGQESDLLAALEAAAGKRLLYFTSETIETVRDAAAGATAPLLSSRGTLVADRNLLTSWFAKAPWEWVEYWRHVKGLRVFHGSDPIGLALITEPQLKAHAADDLRTTLDTALGEFNESRAGVPRMSAFAGAVAGILRRAGISTWEDDAKELAGMVMGPLDRSRPPRESPVEMRPLRLWDWVPPVVQEWMNDGPIDRFVSHYEGGFLASTSDATQTTWDLISGVHTFLVGRAGSGKSVLAAQWIANQYKTAVVVLVTNPTEADHTILVGVLDAVPEETAVVLLLDRAELNPAATQGLIDLAMQMRSASMTVLIVMSRDVYVTTPSSFQRIVLPRPRERVGHGLAQAIGRSTGVQLSRKAWDGIDEDAERFRVAPRALRRAAERGRLSRGGLRTPYIEADIRLSESGLTVLRIVGFLRGVGVRVLKVPILWEFVRETHSLGEFERALKELAATGWVAFPEQPTGEVFAPVPFCGDIPSYEAVNHLTLWELYARFVRDACREDRQLPDSVRTRILAARATWVAYDAASLIPLLTRDVQEQIALCAVRVCPVRWRGYFVALGELARWNLDRAVSHLEGFGPVVRVQLALRSAFWFRDAPEATSGAISRLVHMLIDAFLPAARDLARSVQSWRECYDLLEIRSHVPWAWLDQALETAVELWSGLAELVKTLGAWDLRRLSRRLRASPEGLVVLAFLVGVPVLKPRSRLLLAARVPPEMVPSEVREAFVNAVGRAESVI